MQDHIKNLIDEQVVSGLIVFEEFYKESDFEYLEKNKRLSISGNRLYSLFTLH